MTAALIARLEAATEGSRELDWEIYLFVERPAVIPAVEPPWSAMDVSHYTTSLDAARSLWHPDWYPLLWRREDHELTEPEWWCQIDLEGGKTIGHAVARTPELAAIIATLKARWA